ncbi:unnamed protein product [Paramecium primaurelia]|uniref:Uncharacterized protein n=1 Tax=Paramecium primaurelia TaxID=5886 RepID=A0A8S1NM08_PARPR|nr:unnamed protein product [Paramecium primaurelia]
MGSVGCCKNSPRVDTLKFDDVDSSSQESIIHKRDDQFSPRASSPGQEAVPLQINQRQPQMYQKHACISTALQSYSFKTISSEQHFSNFITFQALPSSRDQQSSKVQNIRSNFLEDLHEIQQQLSCEFQSNEQIKLPSQYRKNI